MPVVWMNLDWRALFLLLVLEMGRVQGDEKELRREERQALYPPPLVNPYGGSVKLVVGFAVPIQIPGRILVYGQNMQFQYMLPDNATFFTNYFQRSVRRRRAIWNERAVIFDILRQELDRRDIDGKECLKKDICEAAATPLKDEGLVGELLHLLLTPDYEDATAIDEEYLEAAMAGRKHENCSTIYPSCPPGLGILDRISKIY
ncbi:uncharacterized protein LOC143430679 [Xylocopa sonorina]|uniref:uncharacterized protein LOC143430679 n=1 Tax=Xylocopa sonorina TaxID=1818115 RepID=UPI00403A96AD